MQTTAERNDLAGLLDANLSFHLALCGISGNTYLVEQAYNLLTPFFAFVRIRAIASGQDAPLWAIVELIQEGVSRRAVR
jgi:DNA-binding GntR family transcriptional regulator